MTLKTTNATYHLHSEQVSDGEKSQMEMAGDCKFTCKDGKYYIMYEEKEPEPEQSTITTIKIDGNVVWVKRSGPVSTHLCYEVGKTYDSAYQFDVGVIMLETTAQRIDLSISEEAAHIEMEYLLDMGGLKTQNQMCIDVKRKSE